MMWGVFDTLDAIHTVPVDDNDRVRAPHVLDEMCMCSPRIELVEGTERLIVIHNEEN